MALSRLCRRRQKSWPLEISRGASRPWSSLGHPGPTTDDSARCRLFQHRAAGELCPPQSPGMARQHRLPEVLAPLMISASLDREGPCDWSARYCSSATSGLAALDIGGGAQADESRSGTFHRRHVGGWYGPKSHYAPFVQTGVYDSCWRRRVIAGPWGPEVLSKWICGNYLTYSRDYDYGYGSAPADRLPGYPSWWW